MSTEGIPSDSTRVKITEMFARLGKSQHTEVQPAKITTDDIRNAVRRLGETRDEPIKTFDIEPPQLSDEQLAKLMEQFETLGLKPIDEPVTVKPEAVIPQFKPIINEPVKQKGEPIKTFDIEPPQLSDEQ